MLKVLSPTPQLSKRNSSIHENDYGVPLEPVTAVLLNWKRKDNLRKIVLHLNRYTFIKEIIIWNNNQMMELSTKDFPSVTPLNIYNSLVNLHDFGKYLACSLAKYRYCYFQDDDWLNVYMRSLYLNFLTGKQEAEAEHWLQDGNIDAENEPMDPRTDIPIDGIWTNTIPEIHVEHQRWMNVIVDSDINLHTGFTWIGTGSFISQTLVQAFLQHLGKLSKEIPREKYLNIDIFFSIFTNRYPFQLTSRLKPLPQPNAWSDRNDSMEIVFRYMLSAASIMHTHLSQPSKQSPMFSTEAIPFSSSLHARSPCHNDLCLFYSSLSNFPSPDSVTYSPFTIKNIPTLDERRYAEGYPRIEEFTKSGYWNAVDGEEESCWVSRNAPDENDYVALQFTKPVAVNQSPSSLKVEFTMLAEHSTAISRNHREYFSLRILISSQSNPFGASDWVSCTTPIVTRSTNLYMTIQVTCSTSDLELVRWVKLRPSLPSSPTQIQRLSVCKIEVGDIIL
ncbi:hypothetical protein BKA69DRAFT_1122848 [Paraphysoderma sedebokerense]|nr:hypothetical protein BKA69DRAFT_1122848 [Paraphysoderma sedebokerense]